MWFSSSPIGKSEARQAELELLFQHWRRYVPARASTALARSGLRSVQEVAALGRAPLSRLPNVGTRTLEQIASLLAASGLAFVDDSATPQSALERTLALSINDPSEVADAARDCLNSLMRAGFILTARK